MTPAQQLFGQYGDFLAHTLDHARTSIEPVQIELRHAKITLSQVGVLEYLPSHPQTEAIVLSAGVHGNETAPIELLNMLVAELLGGQLLADRPILFILGHPVAMAEQSRFIKHNMNRLFYQQAYDQKIADCTDAVRADILKKELKRFHHQHPVREHYDLHTAIRKSVYPRFAVCPFQNTQLSQTMQYHFLQACGVQAILLQDRPAATFSAFSVATFSDTNSTTFGYTVELGQARPFGMNNLADYHNTISALRRLISGQPAYPDTAQPDLLRFFRVTHEIIHSGEQFSLNIAENAENFTPYDKGTEIWHDRTASYRVRNSVEYIAFPNSKVNKGERAGLMLIEVPAPR